MKPLKLELEGFMCFREATEIAFDDLDLFVISGPTGSGKSSLLDALMYALYGQTPRLGSTGLMALLHPDAEQLHVMLDFEVGQGQVYRIIRMLRRQKGSPKQELRVYQQQPDATFKQFPDVALREMNERITGLVGLDYDSFIRAVLLPQGAFDEFLRGSNSKRIELLIRLLGLERITDMQKEAGQIAKNAKSKMQYFQEQLETDFADVTPQTLRKLKDELTALQQQEHDLKKRQEHLSSDLKKQQDVKTLQDDLNTITKRLSTLAQQEPDMKALKQQLELARTAAKLMPLIAQLETHVSRLKTQKTEFEELQRSFAAQQTQFEQAQARLTQSEQAAERIPELSQNIEKLAALTPRIERLQALGGQLSFATQARTGVTFSEASWQVLQNKRSQLPQYKQSQQAVKTTLSKLEQLSTQQTTLAERIANNKAEIDGLIAEGTAVKERMAQTEKVIRDLEAKLDAAQRADAAALLKPHLHVGDACPVCEQIVKTLPAQSESQVAALQQQRDDARKTLSVLTQEREDKLTAYQDKRSALKTDEERLKDVDKQLADARAELEAQQTQFAALQETFAGKAPEDVMADISAQERAQLAALAATIVEQSDGQDPVQAANAYKQERKTLEANLTQARNAMVALQRQLDQTQARVSEVQKRLATMQQDADAAQETLDAQLAASAFATPDAVKQAFLSEKLQEDAQAKLEAFAAQKRDAERDEVELLRKLQGRSFDSEAYAALEMQVTETRQAYEQTLTRSGQLQQQISQLETQLEKAKDLRAQLAALEAQASTYEQLSKDLQRNRFPEYLLTKVQEQLAFRASTIMRETSEGRYDLRLNEGNYYVLDAWNTGELREAKTLSGGETFIASLSLALALSETIAGNTVLGALFLDEGFGTLDTDTLHSVATVLESLTEEGRMVGLITHVAELTERIPNRLMVKKDARGSSVRWMSD